MTDDSIVDCDHDDTKPLDVVNQMTGARSNDKSLCVDCGALVANE